MVMPPSFLIWSPPYRHTSSGIRALFRLCHHLNRAGYSSAIMTPQREVPAGWRTPLHTGPVGDSIVIYPEIVTGNLARASKVVRWVLNDPGLLGGNTTYPDEEMVFLYDVKKLDVVNRAVSRPLGVERVLWMGLVDPAYIYRDSSVPRDLDCSFTYKGKALSQRFPLPEGRAVALESLTPSMAALGATLRRTRTLYSFDHYSNVLREAVICGCTVRTIDEMGVWHDPRGCDCKPNIAWSDRLAETYAADFHDAAFVERFISEIRRCWEVPLPVTRPPARLAPEPGSP
jgi:hypothetical protein